MLYETGRGNSVICAISFKGMLGDGMLAVSKRYEFLTGFAICHRKNKEIRSNK